MIEMSIKKLVQYGRTTGLIEAEDEIYARNQILEVLKMSEYEEPGEITDEISLEDTLNALTDYAAEQGILENNSVVYRDLFDTRLMNCLMPRPSEVVKKFRGEYEKSPEDATAYFYKLSQDSDYIRRYRVCKDLKWITKTEYGDLDITVNLSKPEKDPKAIAAAKTMKQSGYPKCLLCMENVGYAGRINHPARNNHRIIPLTLNGESWGFQYSPYVYYNEHCIVFNGKHTPMKIDRAAFRKVFEQYEFDSVIHFAASKAVGESVAKPLEYYGNNLTSFMNVIGLMREFGRRNIVFSSSCTVYGEPEKQPVTEQTPRKPATSPYGNTKQMCEDILRDSIAAYPGMKGIALRYFNPIGAHPSALIGELPRGVPQNLVPFITQTAAGLRECLSVFGDDYPTPDGSCIRDYIDVVDLAKAHVAAIARMIDGKEKQPYEIFNVGTGNGVSVLELVRKFEEVNGVKVCHKIAPRRAGDIVAIWADPTLANTELGWKAERTLDETLRAAWAWEKHLRGINS